MNLLTLPTARSRRIAAPMVLCLLLVLVAVQPARAQEVHDGLVWEYVQARTRAIAERHLRETRGRVTPQPPEMVPAPKADSIRQVLLALFAEPAPDTVESEPAYEIHHTYLAGKFERTWYRRRYGDVEWSYLGANDHGPLDTLWTHELRARLQARFGSPTQRLTDFSADSLRGRDDFPQFEYWFVLNGSVPFLVMDTNGPFERGLVVATDQRFRDQLRAIRQAFLGPLVQQQEREPYTDYYFDREGNSWHRIQFDGEAYDLRPERPPHSRNATLLERLRKRQRQDVEQQ